MPSAPWKPYCTTFLGDVAAVSFDPYTDLLWTATSTGTVVSHFLPTSIVGDEENRGLERYTSFKSHSYPSPKTSLIISERGVFSLGAASVKCTNRRGLPHWYSSDHFQDARAMAFTAPKSVEIVVGGAQPHLVLLNAATGAAVRKLELGNEVTGAVNGDSRPSAGFSPISHISRSQSLVCCGAQSGTVALRDPTTLKQEHSMMAHYAGLEQMETEGNYLVTCGFSLKQGHPVRDPLVKVFDIRALRPIAPITFASIPALVRFHPRMPSTLFIASSIGQLQILDLANPLPTSSFYQLEVGNFITNMSISSSGEGLAYAEADGLMHLWTTVGGIDLSLGDEDAARHVKPVKWSRGNIPIELADPVEMPSKIDWTDETPLHQIGMPYYSSELLSVLPYETYITPYSPLYQARPIIDPDLVLPVHHRHPQSHFSKQPNGVFDGGGSNYDKVHYLPNPKKTKRYQASLPALSPSYFSTGAATARVGAHPHHPCQTTSEVKRRLSVPLFRSEKEKAKGLNRGRQTPTLHPSARIQEADEIDFNLDLNEFEKMPKWYQQVEIKYSKFGIEDFDFGYYNNTRYSGLETHIVNSYTNSLLQILYHTFPVRKVAESHVTMACATLNCMLCELGFLFKMLNDARGVNCQATNFSKSFSINQRAIALELMDNQHQDFFVHQNQNLHRTVDQPNHPKSISISSKSYSSLIQLCHHFLLDQISEEASKVLDQPTSLRFDPVNTQIKTSRTSTCISTFSSQLPPSPINDIYAIRWQTNQTCSSCQHQTSRTTFTKVIELIYPRKALSNEPKPMSDFCSIVKNSMVRDTTAKSLCSNCNQYTHQRWRRQLDDEGIGNRSLPSVLAINAGITNPEQLEVWLDTKMNFDQSSMNNRHTGGSKSNTRFLQPEIALSVHTRANDTSNNGPNLVIADAHPLPIPDGAVTYELRGMIIQIQSDDEAPHLVSLVKVDNEDELKEQDKTPVGSSGQVWYLFNDFLVRKISEEEALSFPAVWKIPCVLYYVRKDINQVMDLSRLPSSMDQTILLNDINLSKCRDMDKIRHEVLTMDELPKKGDLVAIDAEFVSLQQEEVDYKSDGTRIVRRPSRMTLARVSVLRGEGSKTGVPFIDDHIQTFEPIADYLTEFSGIRPGDLDDHISPHTLVPLKVAYKKLRVLVDLGCVFIGHGLSKDFRIINIYVPPSQIIDTVDLYHIPSRQRKLSLRLLSYLILKHDIQNTGMHDSIEDARTALQLYDIYRQMKNEGAWEEELENVYRKGKEMGWKVAGSDKARFPSPANAFAPSPPTVPTAPPPRQTKDPPHLPTPAIKPYNSTPLSATSATYFPSNVGPAVSQAQPVLRGPPFFRPRPLAPSIHSEHSSHMSLTSPPIYGNLPPSLHQVALSPPMSNFTMSGSGFGNQPNNTPFVNATNTTSLTNPIFQRYADGSIPVFEPKKKMTGFNPMAPSFVQTPARAMIPNNPPNINVSHLPHLHSHPQQQHMVETGAGGHPMTFFTPESVHGVGSDSNDVYRAP